jgi:hypothetical protein
MSKFSAFLSSAIRVQLKLGNNCFVIDDHYLAGDRRTRVQCAALAANVKKWDQPDQEQQRGLQTLIVSNGEVKTVENTDRQVIDVAPAMLKQIAD